MEHAELVAGLRVRENLGDTFELIATADGVTQFNVFEMEDLLHDRVLFAPESTYRDSKELALIRTEVTFATRTAEKHMFTFYRVNRELMNYRNFTFDQDENTSTPLRDHITATVIALMEEQSPAIPYNGHSFPVGAEQLERLINIVPCGLSLTTDINCEYTTRVLTVHVLVRLYYDAPVLLNLATEGSLVLTDEGKLAQPIADDVDDNELFDPLPPQGRMFWDLLRKEGPFNIAMLFPSVE